MTKQQSHPSRFVVAAVAVTLVTAALACQRREHTRSGFGLANRAFFDRQAKAAGSGSAQGLDSEESALIHQRYRANLGSQRSTLAPNDPRSSVMILQEERRDAPRPRP